jgi:hypothetical protein
MAAMLTVIWWRDIPAQVIAKDRRQSHKVVLHDRYIEQWRKEQRPCSDDLTGEAEAEAARLEAAYPKERLNALVAAGGATVEAAEA